jgi:hypothetical protein
MKTNSMTLLMSVVDERNNPFGGDTTSYTLRIYRNESNGIGVCLLLNDRVVAEKLFRDSETQHSDSERWLNDQVGYPNHFAGILLHQDWVVI